MSEITCSRCGTRSASLDRPPLPGALGEMVVSRTCPRCWQEWRGMQVKIINEYRLSPADPKHFDYLVTQMKAFLHLEPA